MTRNLPVALTGATDTRRGYRPGEAVCETLCGGFALYSAPTGFHSAVCVARMKNL